MVDASRSTSLNPFIGLDNRSRESSSQKGALRECENLDITREGGLLVRAGMTFATSGSWTSLFSPSSGRYLCAVKDGVLGTLIGDTFTGFSAVAGTVSYAELNNEVFWSDGSQQGRIRPDGSVSVWGLNPPTFQASAVSGEGGLHAGSYQVTLTAVVAGLESGAVAPMSITVADGGGVRVIAPNGSGVSFNAYMTPNGGGSDTLRQVASLAPGASVVLGALQPGKRLDSLLAIKPPPATTLCVFRGRIWGASDTLVWFTDALSPHWVFPKIGHFVFESPIVMVLPAEDGLFIATAHRTYFLGGDDPSAMRLRVVDFYGAVSGTGVTEWPLTALNPQGMTPARSCGWLSLNGSWCVGRSGGVVQRVSEDSFRFDAGGRYSSSCWEREGMRLLLISVNEATDAQFIAQDIMVAKEFEHGISLLP